MGHVTKLFIGGILILSGTAVAQTPAPTSAVDAEEKKVCRMITVTGALSRRKKVCATKAEWEQQRRDAQEWGRDKIDGCTARNLDPDPNAPAPSGALGGACGG
jgi:hypothetical protein